MRDGQGDGRPGARGDGRPPAAARSRRPATTRRFREGGAGGRGEAGHGRGPRPGPDRRQAGPPGPGNGRAADPAATRQGGPGGDPGPRRDAGPGGRIRGPIPPAGRPGRTAGGSSARGSLGGGSLGPGRKALGRNALARTGLGSGRGGRGPRRTLTRGSPPRRLRITMLCIGFVLSLVAGRLVQLQAMQGSQYQATADRYRLATIAVPSVRGSITSADGTTLAMTVQTDLVHADPPMILRAKRSLSSVASALAGPLGMTSASVLALLSHPSQVSPDYVVLKRSVPATTASQISALNLPGIAMTPSYTRVYPNGNLAANVVGFTNTAASGVLRGEAGVEQSYNSLLTGRAGQQEVQVGTNQQPIPVAGQTARQMVPGGNVRLSIVAGLQWEAEQACAQEVKKTDASNCTVVVMQPSTGKILAMAQAPTFNPAQPASLAATTDIPVSNVFDPGSTAKVITAAAAMEHGGQTPMSAYTVPESINIDGFSFHDAEYHPTEKWTIAGIIAHSSNVGMVQVTRHVTPQTQYQYFRNFGIGSPSVPGLPAQSNGILYPASKWWGNERYTLSFGQGVAVTAVQMASVYATIANGGVRVSPSIVDGTTNASGRFVAAPKPASHRVIQAKTAHQLMGILQQVPWLDAQVGEPWAEIPGYSIAAKTGTAQIADPKKGGCLCLYGSSLIGIAPAGSPKLVVAVNVQNPRKGGYFGIQVAGPVFYKVMKFALTTMKIPPDHAKRPNVRLTAP